MRSIRVSLALVAGCVIVHSARGEEHTSVSFERDIRPIFAARCIGCHQPAKASGNYVMTAANQLFVDGDRGEANIVPGKPEDSQLLQLITPHDGEAEMPMGGAPLDPEQIELVRRWIAEGAKDDSPTDNRPVVDSANPPVYTQPPVVTSVDFSPNGDLLAVAGHHEIRVFSADGSNLVGRLIGISERIETVRFSPDGKLLAAAAGNPGRNGEVQVWDIDDQQLVLSVAAGFDTVRGISWSPDGTTVAYGCSDNTVRAINAESGEEVLFQSAPDDWPLDTVFSVDGSHLVSVGRDMTAKLIEVPTQRFIDNITSITPGALKGGIHSVARHPARDEVLFGGADGVPRIYRMHRHTKRVIGDDANLLLELPPLAGRIFGVDFSGDGTLIAAGSSLDGSGSVHLYRVQAEPAIPDGIAKLLVKPTHARSADETKRLQKYFADSVETLAEVRVDNGAVFSVTISPDGQTVAAAGTGGVVRLIDVASGEVNSQFDVATITEAANHEGESGKDQLASASSPASIDEPAFDPVSIDDLIIEPMSLHITSKSGPVQFVVIAVAEDGAHFDATRTAAFTLPDDCATIDSMGRLTAVSEGAGEIEIRVGEMLRTVPLTIARVDDVAPDYIRDVNPVLARTGCNAGTCHGSKDGKNGFKLSLRGYDPLFDVRSLTDDHASRRVNLASPADSLMLLKATAAVPHEGQQVLDPDGRYYRVLRDWIEHGAQLDSNSARVVSVTVTPSNPVIDRAGGLQQVRVVAQYADGTTRDVTGDAFIESGNTDVVAADEHPGLLRALRRGEAPVLVRYEGAYAATTLTVMGDRSGFVWDEPAVNNQIDVLVADKLRRTKTSAAPLTDDYTFLRRIYLDLTGLPPSPEAIREFIADQRPAREKRDAVVDALVGSDEYVEHWTNKWADLLQVNGKFLGREGATALREWIRGEVAANTPYDEFAHKVLTASGSNRENPAASYYKTLRTPEDTMENTTHLFLATRFNCNKCHDHPFERWTQDQYYQMTAFFAQVRLDRDPEGGDRMIGQTAVEAGKPLYEIVVDAEAGETVHERTGEVTPPEFPFECDFDCGDDANRRERMAAWITSPDNPYFARSYVNRLWGYLLGRGIIEPIDDIRAGNPATNPELLDFLTEQFVDSGFDAQHVVRLICKSATYQRTVQANEWNSDDQINFSHASARRLPAEVLFDAVHRVTGARTRIPGVPPGTRAAALPDAGIKLADGFLDNLGRPSRESACECERVNEMQLGPVMALVSGPTIGNAISDPGNEIARLAQSDLSEEQLIGEIYLRILNRPPGDSELQAVAEAFDAIEDDHAEIVARRDDFARQLQAKLAERELQRQRSVIRLEGELANHRDSIAAQRKRLETARADAIKQAEQQLKAYEDGLAATLDEWGSEQAAQTPWRVAQPASLATTIPGELIAEPDGSIRANLSAGKGNYQIALSDTGGKISAVRLECLPHADLPSGGPGLADNGNFVLSEFSLSVAQVASQDGGDTKEERAIALANPRATFSQGNYDIAGAIDGKSTESSNGWAISPRTGEYHVALFPLAEPIEVGENEQLVIRMHHHYSDGKHCLGRFKISVTDTEGAFEFGLPGEIGALLAIEPETRSPDQTAALLKYRQENDSKLTELRGQLEQAQQPVPKDATQSRLEQELAQARKALPVDARLRELERHVALSERQLSNRRLTAAQDLAWALINSPAFLYNH